MLRTYDVGSLPLRVEEASIREGARKSQTVLSLVGVSDEASKVFESEVVSAFMDKLWTGMDIPNYPQFRDMNEMFFELIQGIKKEEGGYVALRAPSAKPSSIIPEVDVLRKNASQIRDDAGIDKVRVKACLTGPYTLSSFFQAKTPKLFEDLGHALADIVSRSIFDTRHGEVSLVCIDEPVIGFLNDPLLDYGSEGRGALRRAWDEVFRIATAKGLETSMHLHDTSDDLFWEVEHLGIVESHVDDPLYAQETTKRRLEDTDKRLKASISITLFDKLIESHLRKEGRIGDIQQGIGEVWDKIRLGRADPFTFIEDPALLMKRLRSVVERFGEELVPYAGPECGLGSWPTYETAFECLRRISKTIKAYNKNKR
ncbi:MAG: hypothetical protein ACETVY_02245 [Candidatus Bathyarchaeia archaeon]